MNLEDRATSLYAAMCRESATHGIPTRFATDLHVHDRKFLNDARTYTAGNKPPAVFGWILYECGTHVMHPSRDWTERRIVDLLRDLTLHRCYLAEAGTLRAVSPRELAYVLSGERERDRVAGNATGG